MDRNGDMEMAMQLRNEFAGGGGRERGGRGGRDAGCGGGRVEANYPGGGRGGRGGLSGGSNLNPAGQDLHFGTQGIDVQHIFDPLPT